MPSRDEAALTPPDGRRRAGDLKVGGNAPDGSEDKRRGGEDFVERESNHFWYSYRFTELAKCSGFQKRVEKYAQ